VPALPAVAAELRTVRRWLWLFVLCLVLSGLTAFPLRAESGWLLALAHRMPLPAAAMDWFTRIHTGLTDSDRRYPFLAYGYDWLAFAHLVIAGLFLGPLRDPVRNVWVVRWALGACAGILPLALVCGPLRQIPLAWRFVDMSFGLFGAIPLLLVLRAIRRLERAADTPSGAAATTDRPDGGGRPR
jgi:hypothetical protein